MRFPLLSFLSFIQLDHPIRISVHYTRNQIRSQVLIWSGAERRGRLERASRGAAAWSFFYGIGAVSGPFDTPGKKMSAAPLVVVGGVEHNILRKWAVPMGGQGEQGRKIRNFGLTRGQAFLYNIPSVLESARTRFLDDRSRGDPAVVVGGDDALRSKWIQEVYRNGSYLSA